jgi:hypothetical protein
LIASAWCVAAWATGLARPLDPTLLEMPRYSRLLQAFSFTC